MSPMQPKERKVNDLDPFKPKPGYAIIGVAAVLVVLLLVGAFVWSASHESTGTAPDLMRPGIERVNPAR